MKCGFPSLQELTFNIIIKEFSRYSSAYSTTTNRDLKKSLHFLQRVYTQRVFSELVRTECLEKQHLDFVINEYLKKLDVGILFKLFEKEVVFDKVSKIGHSLVELHNNCMQLNLIHAFKLLVPYFTHVTKMVLLLKCDDETLKLIAASCSQISELYIYDSMAVTGVGLSALYLSQNKCPLKILHIYNKTSIDCYDFKLLLENMPTLQEVGSNLLLVALDYIYQEYIHNALENIPKYNLRELDFTGYTGSPILASYLSICSKLCPLVKKLTVLITQTEELQICSQFLDLEDLSVTGTRFNSSIESRLVLNGFLSVSGSKLKNLSVTSCTLSMSTLIAHCPNLKVLVLHDNQFQKLDECVTNTLPKLKSLEWLFASFNDNFHIESIFMLLNSSPILESLSISCCFLNSETKAVLSNFFMNCCIKHVMFKFIDIGFDLLQLIILYCKSLESLCLYNCFNISSTDIDMLKKTIFSCKNSIDLTFNEETEPYQIIRLIYG